ncbi:DUF5370 family protein [Bacillus suaedaesalsae]|uniref:DUF5370 family protein n=1 Tax=Bacillus suaedaesalsae TaxID=2810349 RepID=A0ABS2DGH4_9BACI|nr:DUF5370 family protein [Bacillus suaedaesalsae]MBM6617564.1 DUF5370 family protein [Bacillus suaedaesalsae]
MGAIEQDGYIFETEYSVMLQKGAIHVSRNGEFIKEIDFTFIGKQPDPRQIEELIEDFFA